MGHKYMNIAGGLKSVANEVKGYKLDIVAMQEVRWPVGELDEGR